MSKQELMELIISGLNQEVESLTQSARSAHEAATHEESKQEDSHDTRGLEASYLAGAQMARIESLRKIITSLHYTQLRNFKSTDPIDVGAVIEVECNGKRVHYLLLSHGGGRSIVWKGKTIQIISPQSPMGEALLGRTAGDTIEVEGQRQNREYEIVSVY